MRTEEELKKIVREKYSEIAGQANTDTAVACCGASSGNACCSPDEDMTIFSEDYSNLGGYNSDADLGLGCGLPTEFANIQAGDTVLDLGSGAGNDCFVARSIVGASGQVIGVDMTAAMIEKARQNAQKLNLKNVEFRLGEIEHLPVETASVDVVVSNCVLNLVPDKRNAFSETYRVLKSGGHFSVSDIVSYGEFPENLLDDAALYAGCISGAIDKEAYLQLMVDAGFVNIKIQKEKPIDLPDELIGKYMDNQGISDFKKNYSGLVSITVYGEKP